MTIIDNKPAALGPRAALLAVFAMAIIFVISLIQRDARNEATENESFARARAEAAQRIAEKKAQAQETASQDTQVK